MAPLVLRPSPFFGSSLLDSGLAEPSTPVIPFSDPRFTPRYPVRSPLEDVLRFVSPGSDEYVTEQYAFSLAQILDQWKSSFLAGDLLDLKQFLDVRMEATPLRPAQEVQLRQGSGVDCVRREPSRIFSAGSDRFLQELTDWIEPDAAVQSAVFEITSLEEAGTRPLAVHTTVRYSLVLRRKENGREQRSGTWLFDWVSSPTLEGSGGWKITRFQAGAEIRASVHGPGFVDRTRQALGRNPSYEAQMLHGSDHWRTVLDGASGIDVYGNNGIAAGDFDNDGFDDLYVCQPAGLPNRLYRNRGDGTLDDVTDKAGVGVLDNTACALFADLRNTGLQDLLVVCGNGPLLFLNQGDGTFKLKPEAFRFARAPQGTFTHAAVADYDRDGHLDVYFCLYSYYLGLDQYHYPTPYFDARNGPPNFLMHNEGDATFTDRTETAGLHVENNRYSFACAWGESASSKAPDLYVVNDFGRNNLYLNNGDGTFRSSATTSHVEDVGAGMSACWTDYNNDERQDLYVANMWSAAGQRISHSRHFHESAPEPIRELYQRHARGNALYRNKGDSRFSNESEKANVEMGGWAWCSDAWDFDHDGYSDLYVTNGYISAAEKSGPASQPVPGGKDGRSHVHSKDFDLGSFFWRQVVAKSPENATPSLTYEHGWNALNELIRSDASWSGHERNVMLANNRDGTFSDVSGAVGLDFLEDGRSFALADLDHDGRLEMIVKNRNAPQLRILWNSMKDLGDSIAFRLRGTRSNRDAIGSVITITVGELRQSKSLQSGTGFLAQHSKEVFFGLGRKPDEVAATVRWPSGTIQHFKNLPRNSRIELTEGEESVAARPFTARINDTATHGKETVFTQEPSSSSIETWLIDPLKSPPFSLPDLQGNMQTLEAHRGRFVLLYLWDLRSPLCLPQLDVFAQRATVLGQAQLRVVAINLDPLDRLDQARAAIEREKLPYPSVFASDEVAGIYNIIYRYLFDRRRDLAIPTSFLVDPQGMIVKVYQGVLDVSRVVEDIHSIPRTSIERVKKALPFAGTLYQGEFIRNDFTYGVAMFQRGYLDQAAQSFEQVIAAKPHDAEAYYNLGTLNLRRNRFGEAREDLQRTIQLKPDYPEAWNNLGMMAAQEGHADDAIQHFRRSLELRPAYTTALLNLGNVYRRQHNFADAQDCLTKALGLQPDDPEANYSLGMLYAQQDQMQSASTYLQKAIDLRPDYPEALNNLGVLLIREKEYAEAETQFKTCINLVPGFADSYLNLAQLYAGLHNKEKARAALENLLRVHPENAAAKQGLQTLASMP